MLLAGAYYMFDYSVQPAPPAPPEQHWMPPPLPGSTAAPARSPDADVRLIHYVTHVTPGSLEFSVDVILQNVGSKKATGVQVVVHPYVGNISTSKTQQGPDEIPSFPNGDPMAHVVQNLNYPDLDPDQTSTQSFTLPMRSDADPADSDDKAQVIFQTVP